MPHRAQGTLSNRTLCHVQITGLSFMSVLYGAIAATRHLHSRSGAAHQPVVRAIAVRSSHGGVYRDSDLVSWGTLAKYGLT